MIFLISAIVFSSLFSVIFKICQQRGIDTRQVILFNYVTGAVLTLVPVVTGLLSKEGIQVSDFSLDGVSYACAALQGLLFMLGFVMMDRCVWRAGVALTTVASKASLILSVTLSWLAFRQNAPAWIPVLLTLGSLLLIVLPAENQEHKGAHLTNKTDAQRKKRTMLLLAVVFCLYGVSDFFLKVSQHSVETEDSVISERRMSALMGMIFIVASICSLIWCFLSGSFKKHKLGLSSILGGLVLGLVNALCTSSMLHALATIPTSIYYPSFNIGVVVLSTLLGLFVFKEKVKKIQVIGIFCAVVSILLFFVL